MTTPLRLNGNGPWWAKFISAVGVPAAGLAYLIWWLTTSQAAALEMHTHDQEHAMDGLTLIMRQVCVNTAETQDERTGCFQSP